MHLWRGRVCGIPVSYCVSWLWAIGRYLSKTTCQAGGVGRGSTSIVTSTDGETYTQAMHHATVPSCSVPDVLFYAYEPRRLSPPRFVLGASSSLGNEAVRYFESSSHVNVGSLPSRGPPVGGKSRFFSGVAADQTADNVCISRDFIIALCTVYRILILHDQGPRGRRGLDEGSRFPKNPKKTRRYVLVGFQVTINKADRSKQDRKSKSTSLRKDLTLGRQQ